MRTASFSACSKCFRFSKAFNKKEIAKLAELQFKNHDFKNAEENINKLLAMENVDLSKELARIQFWIEEKKVSPDARKLVNTFEVLDTSTQT